MSIRYQPPHEAWDVDKLQSMIATLESGGTLPPVIVCNDIAFSGSHRLAAYNALELEPDVIDIEYEDIQAAMRHLGLDPIYDEITEYDEFEKALEDLGIV